MANLNQNIHIEDDIEERMEMAWEFKPSTHPPNQNYVVMCVVAPEGTNQKCPDLAIKVIACFASQEQADKYAKKLSAECDFFDYFVAPTLVWLKLPPQVECIDDVHYQEEALTNIKQRLVDMRTARAKLLQERIQKDKEERKQLQIENSTGQEEKKS